MPALDGASPQVKQGFGQVIHFVRTVKRGFGHAVFFFSIIHMAEFALRLALPGGVFGFCDHAAQQLNGPWVVFRVLMGYARVKPLFDPAQIPESREHIGNGRMRGMRFDHLQRGLACRNRIARCGPRSDQSDQRVSRV